MQGPEEQGTGGIGGVGGPSGGGEIDLGQPGPVGLPEAGGAAPPSGPTYPSVMLTGDEGLSKLPDKGHAHVHFHVSSRRQHVPEHGPHKGKTRHEVEMHLHSIRPVRGYKKAASKSKVSEDERAMKKLLGDEGEEE